MGNTIAIAEQVVQEQPTQEVQEEPQEEKEEKEGEQVEKEETVVEEGGDEEQAEETEEAPEEVEEKPKITVDDIKTAPMDFRFPTTNQAKHCYTRYNEFHKCAAEKGEDAKDCQKYARYYRSLCPGEWVDKWNEERENGNYAGRY
jgi:cytochrome c oxidase subunit 6b